MTSGRSVIASATATGWLARGLGFASSLVTLPLVVGTLGKTEYGIWILIGQLTGFLGLSDFGVSNAVGRLVSRYRSAGAESLQKVIASAAFLLLAAGAGALLIPVAASPWVPALLNVPEPRAGAATLAFLAIGLAVGLRFPLRLGQGVLSGYQRYAVINLVKAGGILAAVTGIVGLYATDALTLISLAILVALVGLVEQATLFLMARRIAPTRGAVRPSNATKAHIGEVMSLGSSALVMSTSSMLYRQGLVLAVGWMLGLEEAGLYGVALTIMTYISMLATEVHRPLLTLASEWQGRDDLARLKRASNLVMRFSFALGLCIAAGLYVYGEPILRLLLSRSDWTDTDFAAVSGALAIMGLCLAIGLPQTVSRSILQGVGLHWAATRRFAVASALALAFGVVAMGTGASISGAALGWGIVWLLQGTVLYPPLISRYLGQPIHTMLVTAYLPGAAAGAVTLLVALGSATWLGPATPGAVLAGVALSILAAAGALFAILHRHITPIFNLRGR